MTYRFVGMKSTVAEVALNRFGQRIELEEEVANPLIKGSGPETGFAGSAAILPESEFSKIGFTDKELEDYAWVGTHAEAPSSFLDKKLAALKAHHAFRVALSEDPKPIAPIKLGHQGDE